jgi:hypothetical protein
MSQVKIWCNIVAKGVMKVLGCRISAAGLDSVNRKQQYIFNLHLLRSLVHDAL